MKLNKNYLIGLGLVCIIAYFTQSYNKKKEVERTNLNHKIETLTTDNSKLNSLIVSLKAENNKLETKLKNKSVDVVITKDKEGNYSKVVKVRENENSKKEETSKMDTFVNVMNENKDITIAKKEQIAIEHKKEKKEISKSNWVFGISSVAVLACLFTKCIK